MTTQYPSSHKTAYRFSIAPMMDCTDRHFRVLMRQISRRALLYSEMIVAKALKHNKKPNHLLSFDSIEHPISLQIGGDDPKVLSEATKIAEEWGYDEINLNVGCPSIKVQSGKFGACLMAKPDLVARCIEAMTNTTDLPITIKHRIGIDNLDSYEFLEKFVDLSSAAGAERFAIHARKAFLKGLNPKQNRKVPPLDYERVAKLKRNRPNLKIELNGGLDNPQDCINALKVFDGAMVGRAAYSHPLRWKQIDEIIYQEKPKYISASTVIKGLIPYTEKHLSQDGKLWDICKHILQLVEDFPGARSWRREMSLIAQRSEADLKVLEKAAQQLENVGL